MKLYLAFAYCILCMSISGYAQINKYWLELEDKNGSSFSIDQPEAFLSKTSIGRREKQGIAIDETDLPVTAEYVSAIEEVGAKVLYTSKWFNAVALSCDNRTQVKLKQLPFVKSIKLIGFERDNKEMVSRKSGAQEFEIRDDEHGFGRRQLQALNGAFLHDLGHQGEGIIVAVLDGGFIGYKRSVFFDSLRIKNHLLQSKDFVDGDDNVNHASTHGLKVLSVMAANKPGVLVGMAPAAKYVCIRTEDRKIEMRIEECNWIAGAEYADSIGVDIINTSLGYARFNLPAMDYHYKDMDGKTSLASRASDIAFKKGILVVTSAGNNGEFNDGYIDSPGDANFILTVGATNFEGSTASFSSFGPTVDGRTKPEIVAPGVGVAVASVFGSRVHTASGTSYSAPLVAGLAAALWSAFPDKTNLEIRNAIIQSAEHPLQMNNLTGAGIPDFKRAYEILKDK